MPNISPPYTGVAAFFIFNTIIIWNLIGGEKPTEKELISFLFINIIGGDP